MQSFSFEAIGTHWQIDCECSDTIFASLQPQLFALIEEYDRFFSRFREDSVITQISKRPGDFHFPSYADDLFDLYFSLYAQTDGLFTPLVGNLLSSAGYDAEYSFHTQALHTPPEWVDVMAYSNGTLHTSSPVLLDFGAAGKGQLIDLVSEYLESRGLTTYCVDAGGDLRHRGSDPLRIGLEHPTQTDQVIGTVVLQDKSIAGSAGNRRAWGNFHHIFNPKTRANPTHILSTWVIADTTILADALSTCLFLVPPETLATQYEYSFLILYSDFSIHRSDQFPGEIFQ